MKFLITSGLILCSLISFSQAKENFYVLDSNWQQTVVDSAKYLFWIHQNEDGKWVQSYYHMWGPMIKMETFNDHDGVQRNGLACYYYANGKLDSVGHYRNGKKEGSFVKYRFTTDDSLERENSYEYANDSLVNMSVDRPDTSAGQTTTGDKAPAYPGGLGQWQQFLGKNLQYPDRAIKNKVQGEVKMLLTVDEQGNLIEPLISKSVEYSLDRESLRLIRLSGKWEPGQQNGKVVKTYKIQPIRFAL